jgi:hypothetical protein
MATFYGRYTSVEPRTTTSMPNQQASPSLGGIMMHEENTAVEAQNKRPRSLICELLLTNQKLRIELNRLQQLKFGTQATRPPQFRDR